MARTCEISPWPDGIAFQDAKTNDDRGKKFSRPPTHLSSPCFGNNGYGDRVSGRLGRYTFRNPHKARFRWNEHKLQTLQNLFHQGKSCLDIAKKMKLSQEQVRNKCVFLGLFFKTRDRQN
jgi:hypothetical protein